MSKILITLLIVLTVVGGMLGLTPLVQAANNAQSACVETYTVVAGDTLGTVAQKYLGAIEAYTQIVTATNEAAKTDTSFKTIADANVIEVGQKLCIPAKSASTATAGSATTAAGSTTPAATAPAATATPVVPTAVPLTGAQLGNATYTIDGAPGGSVTLKDGKAEVAQAEGSASTYTATLGDIFANGIMGGKQYSAAYLVTNGGGSGSFYYAAVVPNNAGQPGTGITVLLGDRIKVTGLAFENGLLKVDILDRKPEDPFSVDPTIPNTTFYQLTDGKLVVAQPAAAQAPATPVAIPAGSLAGDYYSSGPAADASALIYELTLAIDGQARWVSNYVGKGTFVSTGTWEQTSPTALNLNITEQDGKRTDQKFTFELQGDKLVATAWDQNAYGDSGITFWKANSAVTGTVSYAETVTLPNNAVVEVYLVDATDANAPATYINGVSFSTNGKQAPIEFAIPFATGQITATGNYQVFAYISADGKLLFTTTNGTPVINGGAPTTGVKVVAAPPAQ